MRLNNTWSGRPQYYDRNPATIVMRVSGIVAGGGAPLISTSYTVPANRTAFVSYVRLLAQQTSVVTVHGVASLIATRFIAPNTDNFAAAYLLSPFYLATVDEEISPGFMADAGDMFTLVGSNITVGNGQVSFSGLIYLTEFDA